MVVLRIACNPTLKKCHWTQALPEEDKYSSEQNGGGGDANCGEDLFCRFMHVSKHRYDTPDGYGKTLRLVSTSIVVFYLYGTPRTREKTVHHACQLRMGEQPIV